MLIPYKLKFEIGGKENKKRIRISKMISLNSYCNLIFWPTSLVRKHMIGLIINFHNYPDSKMSFDEVFDL